MNLELSIIITSLILEWKESHGSRTYLESWRVYIKGILLTNFS